MIFFERIKIVPPFTPDKNKCRECLNLMKTDSKYLFNKNNKIAVYDAQCCTDDGVSVKYDDTLYTYNPTICFINNDQNETKCFLFILSMKWIETSSEGAGGSDCDEIIYLAESLDDIIMYGMDEHQQEKFCE